MTVKKTYEILYGLPQDDSLVIPFGDQPFYSEGFVVRFFNENGSSWVANFCPGFTDVSGVYEYLEKGQILVFAKGKCYLMNPQKKEVVKDFGFAYHEILNDEKGRLITYDDTDIAVVEPTGEIWRSRRISWDGFKDVKIENDTIIGVSYDPTDSINEWKPFSVNLNTKEVMGGSYYEFEPKKSLFSIVRKIIYVILFFLIMWGVLVQTACRKGDEEINRESRICPLHYVPMSEADINYQNIIKVKVGMTSQEVLQIMGEPLQKVEDSRDPHYSYVYKTSTFASDDYKIYFDKSTNKVTIIYRGG